MNVLHNLVLDDRCIGCGVCAGLCPENALAIEIADNGDLRAASGPGTCREGCTVCLKVCPFISGVHDPGTSARKRFGDLPHFHEQLGHYSRCLVGGRTDEVLRRASASGGLVTWCLEQLLTRRLVSKVAVVRWAQADAGKPMFEFFAATSVEEIRGAAGSVYCPVDLADIVREIISNKDPWAVVGVPCLAAALRANRALSVKVPYVLGLTCGMYQNSFYTELLATRSGVPLADLSGVRYRCKDGERRAANFGFVAFGRQANPGTRVDYLGLPLYLGLEGFFRQNACNYCMDVFAETADGCFMDAWLPQYEAERRGTSAAVIRSAELDRLFRDGMSEGAISVAEIDPDTVALSQRGPIRRKRHFIHLRAPGHGSSRARWLTPFAWLEWKVQAYVLRKSKAAWALHGRRGGEQAFWRALRWVRVVIAAKNVAGKIVQRAARVIGGPQP